jgi:hypothetical protein
MARDRRARNPEPTQDRSLRILIEEARMAAMYIELASAWAGDIDQEIAAELMELHQRMLGRIKNLDPFRPA